MKSWILILPLLLFLDGNSTKRTEVTIQDQKQAHLELSDALNEQMMQTAFAVLSAKQSIQYSRNILRGAKDTTSRRNP